MLRCRPDGPVLPRHLGLAHTVRCTACFITRMEVLTRVWKGERERAGRLAHEQLQALPFDWLEASEWMPCCSLLIPPRSHLPQPAPTE